MNLFRIIASGKHKFREEFVSAFIAYLLSPGMDHGLGAKLFLNLIQAVASEAKNSGLMSLCEDFNESLRGNLFDDEKYQLDIELEFPYQSSRGSKRYIDILARYKNWFFVIENKINHGSFTKYQTRSQYNGLRNVLISKKIETPNIVLIYLVPAIPTETGWSTSQIFAEELLFNYHGNDFGTVVYWQPPDDAEAISMSAIIRKILRDESNGEISPLNYDIKQSLKAFIDFALGEFRGYYYQTPVKKANSNKETVSNLLERVDDCYVGIQYGQGGLISKAWRNPAYLNEKVSVSDEQLGWQYLPLSVFKKLTHWAVYPENNSLAGIKWTGKPFWAVNLYRVAKTAGKEIYIGIKGGLTFLEKMSANDITTRKFWELNTIKKNSSWLSGEEFCEIIERKDIREVLDKF